MRNSAFYQEVFADATLVAKRAWVLDVLLERFGEQAAQPFTPMLAKIESQEILNFLHRTAIRCASLDEFQAALSST